VQVRDAGNLLTRAGLTIPAVDVDEVVVRYGTPMELIAHLRVRDTWLLVLNILQSKSESSCCMPDQACLRMTSGSSYACIHVTPRCPCDEDVYTVLPLLRASAS